MMIILGMDGLEYDLVEKWDLKHLKQTTYGKTDLTGFTQLRTIILWSSFLTGENKQEEIMAGGDAVMWDKKWDIKETFFKNFEKVCTIDVPSFNYVKEQHDKERALMKAFFEEENEDKQQEIREEFNKHCFDHHKKIKKEFWAEVGQDYDLLMAYFNISDVIAHLSFGNTFLMKMIYQDLNELVGQVKAKFPEAKIMVISDHGMKSLGYFGEHTSYSFWSLNWDAGLDNPKITDFAEFFEKLKQA